MRTSAAIFPVACRKVIVVGTLVSFTTTGCTGSKSLREFLPETGAVLVGAVCYKLFEGKNQIMATAICAAGGYWLGTKLQKYLDAQEQAQLAEATYKTLDSGQKETVTSEKGTQMTTEVVASPPTAVAPTPPTATTPPETKAPESQPTPNAAPVCRTVRQTIVLSNGDRHEEELTACKEDGKWVPQKKS